MGLLIVRNWVNYLLRRADEMETGRALGLRLLRDHSTARYTLAHGRICVVLDAPTLYETKSFVAFCSRVIVVSVSDKTQLKRLMKRDRCSKEDAKMRIDAQMPLAKKIERCDIHIVNNGTKKQLNEKIDELIAVLNKDSNTIWERVKSPATIIIVTYLNIALFSFSLTGVWPLVYVTCVVGLYTWAFYMKVTLNRDIPTIENVDYLVMGTQDTSNGNDADDESSTPTNK